MNPDERKVTAEEMYKSGLAYETNLDLSKPCPLTHLGAIRLMNDYATLKVQEALKEKSCKFAEWIDFNYEKNIQMNKWRIKYSVSATFPNYYTTSELYQLFTSENK